MEGALLKKTTGGQWHSRQFKLEGSNLTWLKSDGKTTVTVDVSKGAEIRDIKIGPKKFSFDIILPGDTISVAASGEAEKAAWMAAVKVAMGKRAEAEGILQKSGAGRASVRSPLRPINAAGTVAKPGASPMAASPVTAAKSQTSAPVASTPAAKAPVVTASGGAAAAAASPSPASALASPASPGAAATPAKLELGSVVSGGLATQAANAKLAAKIGGKLGPSPQSICVVCGQTVYKPEELIVDKTVMHKRCFQCNHCKRLLTMGNFACINGTFYCKVHYFELFSTNGGKYDKAFGDAGFKTKATTSYTPGEVLQPGKLNGKVPTTLPLKVAASATTSPVKPVTDDTPSPVVIPSSPVADKTAPKKLEIKAPVSTKAVEKKEVEILPKKNMDDLRKMVVLPGMAPPKPKKEEPKIEEPKVDVGRPDDSVPSPTVAETTAPVEGAGDVATETTASDPSEAKAEATTTLAEPEAAEPNSIEEKAIEEAPAPVLEPEPQIQIVRPPAGINFALEAMKIRQAQLEKKGIVSAPQEEPAANEEGRASVRISGRLDHSAVMSKPRMAGRRAPKVQEVGKLLPKADIDRMTHDWTFRVLVNGNDKGGDVLIVHATSQFEKEHWVATIGANVYMLSLKHDLEQAQKRDMMSALQAQLNLEAFLSDNKVTYSGFLEKVSMKSQRNWKKRWFDLTDKGELRYFDNENSKKPKHTLQLTYLTKITAADGTRLDAPLVINTGATEKAEESEGGGQLPQNIAIFDNEDVTIALETLIPEDILIASEGEKGDQPMVEIPPNAPADAQESPAVETPTPVEDSAAAEEKEDAPSVVPESATEEKPAEEPEKVNTAWATPGKSPDRVVKSTDAALNDASPAKSPEKKNSRRKSGSGKDKQCAIM